MSVEELLFKLRQKYGQWAYVTTFVDGSGYIRDIDNHTRNIFHFNNLEELRKHLW